MHKCNWQIKQLDYENKNQQGKEILEIFIRCLAIKMSLMKFYSKFYLEAE